VLLKFSVWIRIRIGIRIRIWIRIRRKVPDSFGCGYEFGSATLLSEFLFRYPFSSRITTHAIFSMELKQIFCYQFCSATLQEIKYYAIPGIHFEDYMSSKRNMSLCFGKKGFTKVHYTINMRICLLDP
jgi:hypothetical protein